MDRETEDSPVFDIGAWGDLLAAEDSRPPVSGASIPADFRDPSEARMGVTGDFSRMLKKRWAKKRKQTA